MGVCPLPDGKRKVRGRGRRGELEPNFDSGFGGIEATAYCIVSSVESHH